MRSQWRPAISETVPGIENSSWAVGFSPAPIVVTILVVTDKPLSDLY